MGRIALIDYVAKAWGMGHWSQYRHRGRGFSQAPSFSLAPPDADFYEMVFVSGSVRVVWDSVFPLAANFRVQFSLDIDFTAPALGSPATQNTTAGAQVLSPFAAVIGVTQYARAFYCDSDGHAESDFGDLLSVTPA